MVPVSSRNANSAANHIKQLRHNVLSGGKPAITARAEIILKSNVRRKIYLRLGETDEFDEKWLAVVGADHKCLTALI